MLRELVQYIEDQYGSGLVIGTNLFAGFRQQSAPNTCVVVSELGGTDDFYNPGISTPVFHLSVRSGEFFEGRTLAYAIHDILHRIIGTTLPVLDSGGTFLVNTSVGPRPMPIGQDERGRFMFTSSYKFETETS